MTGTLLIQYKEFIILIGHLIIAVAFLLLGYAMGRNSIERPVVAVPKKKLDIPPPYEDNDPSIYDEALQDLDERVSTL